MKRYELDAQFTDLVTKYLAKGYIVHTNSMGGSQGEEAKVDLYKDGNFLRIWMESKSSHSWSNREEWHGSRMIISVGNWKNPYNDKSPDIMWMQDFDVIEEYTYYNISNRGYYSSEWYVESKEEAMEYQHKHYARYADKSYKNKREFFENPQAIAIAKKYLKRKLGYQRVSESDIYVSKSTYDEKEADYFIDYKGHVCSLR